MIGKIKHYIQAWESRCYSDGLPDEIGGSLESSGKAPSYKMICRAILKNDNQMKTLGFSAKYSDNHRKLSDKHKATMKGTTRSIFDECL